MNSDQELIRRVERLEDIEAIRRVMWEYGLAADDRRECRVNVERTMALFAPAGVWDNSRFGRIEGREAVRDYLSKAPARIEWSLHYLIDTQIEVSIDRRTARGRWYLLESARMVNPKTGRNEMVWITGVYDNEFLREDGRWLFTLVKLDIQKILGETGVWN